MPQAAGMYYFASNEDLWARPAVILLHGAGGNHLYWPPEIRRLPGQRIYALDLPGHGKTDGIGYQSIVDYAREVLAFLDGLKVRKAVFVGHSMGGAIALHLAIHNPSRVLGIGLVATAPRLRVASILIENTSSQALFPVAVQTIMDWSFSSQADPRLKTLAAQRMSEIRPSVLHGDFRACDSFDENDALGRVKAPSLIICGTEDKMTPPHFSQSMKNRLKNSIYYPIEAAGHMVMLEQPLKVAAPLQLFLESISYQPGSI